MYINKKTCFPWFMQIVCEGGAYSVLVKMGYEENPKASLEF